METLLESHNSHLLDWAPVLAYAILFAYYIYHNLSSQLGMAG